MKSNESEEYTIQCNGVVLAVEYIPDRHAVAISLSDRTIVFHDITNKKLKKLPFTLHVPSTQKCLVYIERNGRHTLFSAGVDGSIFAWNLDTLFDNEMKEQLANMNKKNNPDKEDSSGRHQVDDSRKKLEYIWYISEKTPWFVGDIILCLIDLPNINQLASGSYD